MSELTKSLTMFALAALIVGGFFYDSYFILSGQITTAEPQILLLMGTVNGVMASMATQVVSFWFGSSKSSGDKDKTISDMTKTQPTKGD